MNKKQLQENYSDCYVWLYRNGEKTLAFFYYAPDIKQWGFGFNTADGGGFLALSDISNDTQILKAVVR